MISYVDWQIVYSHWTWVAVAPNHTTSPTPTILYELFGPTQAPASTKKSDKPAISARPLVSTIAKGPRPRRFSLLTTNNIQEPMLKEAEQAPSHLLRENDWSNSPSLSVAAKD